VPPFKVGDKLEGWISLHRKIQKHWLWKDKPFSKGQAWIDILMMVNHEDGKAYFRDSVYEVKRGERITSELQLAERWGWSRNKVRKFLDDLKKEQMLEVKKDKRKTFLKVVNYNTYQVSKTLKSTTESTRDETTERQQKDINNNDNNIYTAITIIEDELQKTGNINPVAPVDADSTKQDEDIIDKLNSVEEIKSPLQKIENHYREKVLQRTIVPPKDLEAILQIYEKGYPVDFIIQCIDFACERYKKNNNGKLNIKSFKYFIPVIEDEWEKQKLREAADKIDPKEPEVNLSKAKQKSKQNYSSNNKPKNRFHNFQQRHHKYSNEELEKILGIK
jgi:DNA replication protein DnaD